MYFFLFSFIISPFFIYSMGNSFESEQDEKKREQSEKIKKINKFIDESIEKDNRRKKEELRQQIEFDELINFISRLSKKRK